MFAFAHYNGYILRLHTMCIKDWVGTRQENEGMGRALNFPYLSICAELRRKSDAVKKQRIWEFYFVFVFIFDK